MIRDRLSKTERIRLEAISQAIAWRSSTHVGGGVTNVVADAIKFETYIKEGK